MQNDYRDTADIEICELEYDVAGVGATESSNAEENLAAFYAFCYRLPEQVL